MKLRLALLSVLAAMAEARAQDSPELPADLFGIGLGSVYEYSNGANGGNATGTFPVRRLFSERPSLHDGSSLYFEPLTAYEAYPFRESVREGINYPMSNFRIFVYPVLPEGRLNREELVKQPLPQKVVMIEWTSGDNEMRGEAGYAWASELCHSLESELGIEPEVTDAVDRYIYRCVFSHGDRELEVTSVLGQTIQLSFADDIESQMQAEVDAAFGAFRLQRMRENFLARPAGIR